MIRAHDIRDLNHVRTILDNTRDYIVAHKNQIGELSEDDCENITFQLCEIDEFIIGMQEINERNIVHADIRIMTYWEYVNDKCSFSEMMKGLKKYEGEI